MASLRREADLAKEQDFYLLLRTDRLALQIMYKGILMREYPLMSLEVGRPRVFFRTMHRAEPWEDRIWTGGTFLPERVRPRVTITPPPPGAPAPEEVTIPPLVEEVVPVPPTYRIQYGNLMLIVESVYSAADSMEAITFRERARTFRTWISDRLAGLQPEVVRVKVRLPRADAAHLYRSLPAEAPFAVVASEAPRPTSG